MAFVTQGFEALYVLGWVSWVIAWTKEPTLGMCVSTEHKYHGSLLCSVLGYRLVWENYKGLIFPLIFQMCIAARIQEEASVQGKKQISQRQ